jgi:glycosyltransferase involved in cell wall biosynthesis
MSQSSPAFVESSPDRARRVDAPLGVTHVVISLDAGGLERIVLGLVRFARARGHEPSVLCLERPGTLAAQVEAIGVPLLCAGKRPGLRYGTIEKIRELLRRLKPDVVHTHQMGALLYAGPAARREKVPVVVHTEHGNHIANQRAWSGVIRTRSLLYVAGSFAERFFCVSENIRDTVSAYRTVPKQKVGVVLNGIDTAAFDSAGDREWLRQQLGIPHHCPVIGTVGRLNEVKRQDLLIRGFANVANREPAPHLLLVGDGPELQALRQLAADLGLSDRVHFAGYQAQPEHYLHLMDIFTLTSRLEGMPLAILEAWAAGRPVIASRVGGVPAIITEGETGILFDSGDEAALTQAMSRLLANPNEGWRLGEAGRAYVRSQFDLQVMAESYERHYRELLLKSSRARQTPTSTLLQGSEP